MGGALCALKRYMDGEGEGDPSCPGHFVSKDMATQLQLGWWLNTQRQAKKGKGSGKLSAAQIHRLEQLGVCWEQRTASSWEEYFAALVRYKDGDGDGDPNCPGNYVSKDTSLKLGVWLGRQRQAKKGKGTCKISLEQIHRLEELGVWWDKPDTWEEHFAALERYKDGDGNVTELSTVVRSKGHDGAVKTGWLARSSTQSKERQGHEQNLVGADSPSGRSWCVVGPT